MYRKVLLLPIVALLFVGCATREPEREESLSDLVAALRELRKEDK